MIVSEAEGKIENIIIQQFIICQSRKTLKKPLLI